MKKIFFLLFLIIFSFFDSTWAKDVEVFCSLTNNGNILIGWNIKNIKDYRKVLLLRSSTDLKYVVTNNNDYPVTTFNLNAIKDMFIDKLTADNVTYSYRIILVKEDGEYTTSEIVSIFKPNIKLPKVIQKPKLFIDKINYFLELKTNVKVLKRYPIALGHDPKKRKLHQDWQSTPEGFYKIINKQPKATFYKAYDINYPNKIDRIRYNIAKSKKLISKVDGKIPSIGGEIQIHGGGIDSNWTAGCMAMRNKDIDELFGHREIRVGTSVIIVGSELNRNDLISIMKKGLKKK